MPKRRPQPETLIREYVCGALEADGWYVCRIFLGFGPSTKGIPDNYVLKNGRGIWIEFKTPHGRLSPEQIKFKTGVDTHGGEFRVVRGIDDVDDLLMTKQLSMRLGGSKL